MILAETVALLPRPRPAAADHLLGRAAAGGAEHPLHRHGALAVRRPASPSCIAVLALNFLGDGLRDAADPYNK